MSKHLMFVASIFLLSGCLLKQKLPQSNNNPQGATLQGVFAMRDWHGRAIENPKGEVLAQFAQKSRNASQSLMRGLGLKLPQLGRAQKNTSNVTQCQVTQEPKTQSNLNSTLSMVSVGKISFGTSENNLVSLTEGENHLYSLPLAPDFSEGIYLASVEGTSTTPSFSVKMSMPQRMGRALVQGQDFETSATAFRKSEPLVMSWQAPTAEMDLEINQMEVEIISETPKSIVTVICGAMEKDLLNNSSTVTWEIPVNQLAGLNATATGFVILRRGQWMRASSAEVGVVQFEGVRIYATQAFIAE